MDIDTLLCKIQRMHAMSHERWVEHGHAVDLGAVAAYTAVITLITQPNTVPYHQPQLRIGA